MNQDQPKETEAIGFIHLKSETIRMIKENESGMADVIRIAEEAGNLAVKRAAELIPHIRPTGAPEVILRTWIYPNGIEAKSLVKSAEPASIESEALLAVSTCLISIFEWCRSLDPAMVLSDIRILRPAH
jgi:molybdenum cofactor biosynthesis protein MoaC